MARKKRNRPYAGVSPAPGRDDPELDPFEIEFRPEFQHGRGPHEPFRNEYGVVIGDHDYASKESPLEQWSRETDPAVMSGDQWVHPYKDIGFRTEENREYFEEGNPPQAGVFMHPTQQTSRPESRPTKPEDLEDAYPVPEVLDEP
jgi:hypothetical protein